VVSDNILVTKLSPKEAARGYLISLKASSYSPRYIEAMEMSLRLFADYAEVQGWPEPSRLTVVNLQGKWDTYGTKIRGRVQEYRFSAAAPCLSAG